MENDKLKLEACESMPPSLSADESVAFNPDDYRNELKAFDLSKQEEDELLETLWNIMSILVDIGWGVDTVQLLLPEIFDNVSYDSGKGEADDDTE